MSANNTEHIKNLKVQRGFLTINNKINPIYEGINIIGRSENAIVSIKDNKISKQQAVIVVINEYLQFISDLDSLNGTSIDNEKLIPLLLYPLKDNSVIFFDEIKAKYKKIPPTDIDYDDNVMPLSSYDEDVFLNNTQKQTDDVKSNKNNDFEKSDNDDSYDQFLLNENNDSVIIPETQNPNNTNNKIKILYSHVIKESDKVLTEKTISESINESSSDEKIEETDYEESDDSLDLLTMERASKVLIDNKDRSHIKYCFSDTDDDDNNIIDLKNNSLLQDNVQNNCLNENKQLEVVNNHNNNNLKETNNDTDKQIENLEDVSNIEEDSKKEEKQNNDNSHEDIHFSSIDACDCSSELQENNKESLEKEKPIESDALNEETINNIDLDETILKNQNSEQSKETNTEIDVQINSNLDTTSKGDSIENCLLTKNVEIEQVIQISHEEIIETTEELNKNDNNIDLVQQSSIKNTPNSKNVIVETNEDFEKRLANIFFSQTNESDLIKILESPEKNIEKTSLLNQNDLPTTIEESIVDKSQSDSLISNRMLNAKTKWFSLSSNSNNESSDSEQEKNEEQQNLNKSKILNINKNNSLIEEKKKKKSNKRKLLKNRDSNKKNIIEDNSPNEEIPKKRRSVRLSNNSSENLNEKNSSHRKKINSNKKQLEEEDDDNVLIDKKKNIQKHRKIKFHNNPIDNVNVDENLNEKQSESDNDSDATNENKSIQNVTKPHAKVLEDIQKNLLIFMKKSKTLFNNNNNNDNDDSSENENTNDKLFDKLKNNSSIKTYSRQSINNNNNNKQKEDEDNSFKKIKKVKKTRKSGKKESLLPSVNKNESIQEIKTLSVVVERINENNLKSLIDKNNSLDNNEENNTNRKSPRRKRLFSTDDNSSIFYSNDDISSHDSTTLFDSTIKKNTSINLLNVKSTKTKKKLSIIKERIILNVPKIDLDTILEENKNIKSKSSSKILKKRKRSKKSIVDASPIKTTPKTPPETPSKSRRKLKPKVVFTMLNDTDMQLLVKQLGGTIVDNVETCTVLVTDKIRRTEKFLTAICLSKPICSTVWLMESKKSNCFLDPWDFLLVDKETEKKWDFSLKESLDLSKKQNLLKGYTIQLMVKNGLDVLERIIEACGGQCVTRNLINNNGNLIIVATEEYKSKYKRILKYNNKIKVVESEAIFDSILRQHIRFDKFLL